MPSLIRKTKDYIKTATIFFLEALTLNDKLTIARHYLKTPFFLINHLKGKHNSRILSKNMMIKNKYGIFFCGSNLYCVAGFSSLNEPEIRKKMILDKGVMIDIGANGGMHAIPLGKMLSGKGKVIAIEPEPNNFRMLKKNIRLNNLNNVIAINKGCFSKKDFLTFYLDKTGTGGHSLVKKDVGDKKIKIEVDILDNILKDLKVKKVDLIKIDVEGAELEVLKGSIKTLKKYHPKIIFEAWNGEYLKKIKKILKAFNYKIKQIAEQNYLAY